ncbi:MAG: zinc transport system ATP-binding protein [Thiomicrorhabdus sp.]|nr:MAG: zinc transport system ATP-binding protein [Thiomicrorhabdus sp.]
MYWATKETQPVPNTVPLIEAQNIYQQFGDKKVLNDVSLSIHPKEIVTLIGPNGAGKSTLLKVLLGLIQPDAGNVQRAANLKIGFMPQKIHIDPTLPMSVERFLQLGLNQSSGTNSTDSPLQKVLKKSFFSRLFLNADYDTTALNKIAHELNIHTLLKQPIQKVSGGEMQRILLARVLMREPDLLVLDEPVQGVDIQGQAELYRYINQIRHQHGCGILMVSHDLHIVMEHTDQVLCLNQHLCCSGPPVNVSQSAEYKALFDDNSEGLAIYEHHHDSQTCQHTHGEEHDHNHKHDHTHDSQQKESK